MSKVRTYFITQNNWTEDEWLNALAVMSSFDEGIGVLNYAVLGKEVGKECETPHFHLWLHFKSAIAFSTIVGRFPRANVQVGRGSDGDQAYIKKDDVDFYEFGEPSMQGKRTDITLVKEMVEDGSNMREIITVASSYQSMRCGELILKYKEQQRCWLPEVYWFWGPSGTGKTRLAWELEEGQAWMSGVDGKWFDGYDAHEAVIFDDFRGDFCKFSTLLRLLDRYPYRIECKGGSRQLLAKRMYITCPKRPEDVCLHSLTLRGNVFDD